MQSSNDSFWAEIKNYEVKLKKDPKSFCFSQLAEAYLHVGLVDDAVSVARSGTEFHPGFVAGQMALAKACFRKGLNDECRKALEKVTSAVPENAEAQRMLSRLYAESGDDDAAVHVLKTLLEFCPDDKLAKAELEALQGGVESALDDELDIIEFTEADIVEDGVVAPQVQQPAAMEEEVGFESQETESPQPWQPTPDDEPVVEESPAAFVEPDRDPLTTGTLAELYVSQGFISKALDIYRDILKSDPENVAVAARIKELEKSEAPQAEEVSVVEPVPMASSKVAEAKTAPLPAVGAADSAAVEVLEGWLDNIRRLRACQ